jgi:hypothetical protein
MEAIFEHIYESHEWGTNDHPDYKGSSGGGSAIDYNKDTYVPFLRKFITDHTIRTIVDLGCGDFRCGTLLYDDLDIHYTGYDAYEKVVQSNQKHYSLSIPKYTFVHLDFYTYKESIASADVCLLKDVLQHWSLEAIYEFLDYLVASKKFKHILITNCCNQTTDNTTIKNGDWRPLSCQFLPLKKYTPLQLYTYDSKEVSMISCL